MKILKYLFFTIIIFSACTKEIPFEEQFPFEGEKIVLFAQLTPDNIIKVSVSKSYGTFDLVLPDELTLPDARVELYENNNFVEILEYADSSFFVSVNELRPVPGKSYHFKVSHSDFSDVESIPETIPDFVAINDFNFYEQNEEMVLDFSFTDDGNQTNFYEVDLWGDREDRDRWHYFPENLFSQGDLGCSLVNDNTFEDVCLNGETKSFTAIRFDDRIFPAEDWENGQIYFTLRSISAAFYEDVKLNDGAPDPGFGVPPPTFTNVLGGYGTVLAYNQDVVIIEL